MQVIEAQVDMPIAGAVTLYSSLLTFTLNVHPDRLDYVDQILVGFFSDCSLSLSYTLPHTQTQLHTHTHNEREKKLLSLLYVVV